MGDTITTSMTGGGQGTFTPATGVMTVPVTWHLHNSSFFVPDSDLAITLSTESIMPRGSRLSPMGGITLAGTGICTGGRLAGDNVAISIAGTISPLP